MSFDKHHLCQKQKHCTWHGGQYKLISARQYLHAFCQKNSGGNLLEQGHLLGLLQELNWKFYIKCTHI